MSYQYAQFLTKLNNNKLLITVDSERASDFDLSGTVIEIVVPDTNLGDLHAIHDGQLGYHFHQSQVYPWPLGFSFDRQKITVDMAMNEWKSMRLSRVNKLVAAGQAMFLDAEQNAWRYTFSAACIYTVRSLLRELRRAVWPDRWSMQTKSYWQNWQRQLSTTMDQAEQKPSE